MRFTDMENLEETWRISPDGCWQRREVGLCIPKEEGSRPCFLAVSPGRSQAPELCVVHLGRRNHTTVTKIILRAKDDLGNSN